MKKTIIGIIVIFFIIGGVQIYRESLKKKAQEDINNTEYSSSINNGNINEENWDVKPKDLEVQSTNPIGETPDFTLESIKGEKISLSQFKGKEIFLNFWATWCPPCQLEMPDIEKLYQKYKNDKDFVILTINVGESKEKVMSYIKEHNYNFEVLLDTNSDISLKYKSRYLPTSVIINKEGEITNYRSGAMDFSQMEEFKKE